MTSHYGMHFGFQKNFSIKKIMSKNELQQALSKNAQHVYA